MKKTYTNQEPTVTDLLLDWGEGSKESLKQLIPLIEMELRRLAHNFMVRENQNNSLQTTALVNETYLKLFDQKQVNLQNRGHFFAISAKIMRRILLNHARDKRAEKRGGKFEKLPLDSVDVMTEEKSIELINLDEALGRLEKLDPFKGKIVELRFFGGLTVEETAAFLGVSEATVWLHWRFAKAWLAREISSQI